MSVATQNSMHDNMVAAGYVRAAPVDAAAP